MPTKKTTSRVPEVRAYFIERESRRRLLAVDGPPVYGIARPGRLAALLAGDPVVVSAWELPKEARAGFDPHDRVEVGGDGTLREADRGAR